MSYSLCATDDLALPGETVARWQVVDGVPRAGWLKLFDRQAGQEVYKAIAELNAAIVIGELVLRRKGAARVSLAAQNDPSLVRKLVDISEALRRIKVLQRKHGVSFAQAYKMDMEDRRAAGDDTGPSRASIYRYQAAQRNGLPALKGEKNKGNRTQRYPPSVVELICSLATQLYLQEASRWTLRSLTQRVNSVAFERGLAPQKGRISRAFVRKTIETTLTADPDGLRMDPKLLKTARSTAKNRIVVQGLFERVEQDALHLPFWVATPYGPTSNVYLIHAIDCSTSMPVGWVLFIGAPSATEGLRCVESVLFPKVQHFERLGLDYDFDIYGTPLLLVFDNGPEARAERMHQLVRLRMDVMHCRSREANGKPFIERLNGSVKTYLETLPGCTRMDGQDGQRDPIALGDELMSLEELERWIVRFFYEEWANNPLERHWRSDVASGTKLGVTPLQRWKSMTEDYSFAAPMSPPLKEWRSVLYVQGERVLSRKSGLTYETFSYRGPNLTYLTEKYGENSVKFFANPDDFRQVFVDDGDEFPLIALTEEYADESTPAYDFKQAKEVYNSPERRNGNGENVRSKLQKDVHDRSASAIDDRRSRKSSKAAKNREVVRHSKASQAVRDAAAAPLVRPAHTVLPPVAQSPISFDDVVPLEVRNLDKGSPQR